MIISIINLTKGRIPDEEVQDVLRAINRQIEGDFAPYWSFSTQLRLEGASSNKPDKLYAPDMRGDAIIYLWSETDVEGALGYHDANNRGIPFGFVFTELSKQLGEHWSVTLSHEALELLGDAQANLLVQGPHPDDPRQTVFHWFEMCDAVQAQTYMLDGVEVSNFVLPMYFTQGEQSGGRNDFLCRGQNGKRLLSFGVAPGGYVGFFNPETNSHETFSRTGDKIAAQRLKLKLAANSGRGCLRKSAYAMHTGAMVMTRKMHRPRMQQMPRMGRGGKHGARMAH